MQHSALIKALWPRPMNDLLHRPITVVKIAFFESHGLPVFLYKKKNPRATYTGHCITISCAMQGFRGFNRTYALFRLRILRWWPSGIVGRLSRKNLIFVGVFLEQFSGRWYIYWVKSYYVQQRMEFWKWRNIPRFKKVMFVSSTMRMTAWSWVLPTAFLRLTIFCRTIS